MTCPATEGYATKTYRVVTRRESVVCDSPKEYSALLDHVILRELGAHHSLRHVIENTETIQ